MTMTLGSRVAFVGRYGVNEAALGVVESIDAEADSPYGVRLDDGTFVWCSTADLVKVSASLCA